MKKNIKILFIGNSLTYYNDLPEVVRRFFEEIEVNAECVLLSMGGKCLDFHASSRQVSYNIRCGHYDYIVLQGKVTGFDPKLFVESGKSICDNYIFNTDSKTVLFMPWALKGRRKDQPVFTEAYKNLCEYAHGIMAPVGEAFLKVQRMRPAPVLYEKDANHPSIVGSYLAAATIFYAITGRDRMLRLPEEGGIYTEQGIDRPTAMALNRIACEKAKEFNE